jgi:hypothetical protein
MSRKPRIAAIPQMKSWSVHRPCMTDRLRRREAGRQNSTAKE